MFRICQSATCQVIIWTSIEVFKCLVNTGDRWLAQCFQVEGEQPMDLSWGVSERCQFCPFGKDSRTPFSSLARSFIEWRAQGLSWIIFPSQKALESLAETCCWTFSAIYYLSLPCLPCPLTVCICLCQHSWKHLPSPAECSFQPGVIVLITPAAWWTAAVLTDANVWHHKPGGLIQNCSPALHHPSDCLPRPD